VKIEADRDACCGSGNCVMTVPEVFDQSSADGLVLVQQPEPPSHLWELVHRAAHICPAGAIRVTP